MKTIIENAPEGWYGLDEKQKGVKVWRYIGSKVDGDPTIKDYSILNKSCLDMGLSRFRRFTEEELLLEKIDPVFLKKSSYQAQIKKKENENKNKH